MQGAVVHQISNTIQVVLVMHAQIRLGKNWRNKPLVFSHLPCCQSAVQIAKLHPHVGCMGQLTTTCHLPTLVIGKDLAYGRGNLVELGREGRQ